MGPRTKNANYGIGVSPPREDVESEEEETNSEEDVESEEKSNSEDVESEEEETTEANTKEKDGEDGESSEEEEESEKENASEANTKDKDGEDRENREEEEETDSEDETEPLQPLSMHLSSSYYNNTIKFTTRCYVTEAISVIEEVLNEDEKNWFYYHPQFRHLFHMPKDTNHKTMGMWLLLLRTARIKKEKEVWFVVNGVSVCYSLREHGLISGLCCHDYPKGYDKKGDLKFVKKHFKEKKVTVVEVEKKLRSMKKGGEERLKMAVLFFLGAVMKGTLKGGIKGKGAEQATPIPKFFQKVAPELEFCKSFPWGRFTFLDTLKDIERMMKIFKGAAKPNFIFPSFIIPLEIMAFEAIPCLMEKFREVITEADSGCPRMCKSKFQHSSMRGFSIHEINDALGKTKEIHSVLLPTQDEKQLMSEIMNDHDEDDHIDMIVDGWKKRISDGKSVFFEEYYLNDIKSREQKEDAQENVVQPNVVAEENVVEPNVAVSEYVTVGDLLELKKWMENRFSELNNSIDAQNKRLDRVELVVKELNLGEMNAGNVADRW